MAIVFCATAHSQTGRQRIRLDDSWQFAIGQPGDYDIPNSISIQGWQWHPTSEGAHMEDGRAWVPTTPGTFQLQNRNTSGWFKAKLPSTVAGPHRVVRLGVDDSADVYLNGVKLAHHEGWSDRFTVDLDSAWNKTGSNEIQVLVHNAAGSGGLNGPTVVGTLKPISDPFPSAGSVKWSTVHLPHDYVVEQKFDRAVDAGHAALPTPLGWYRRTLNIPTSAKGKAVWIDFDGVYRNSKVWLNGHLLGTQPSGYTSFRYDLTPFLKYGAANRLEVSCDPHAAEGWWYEGGGIYRHVWLNIATFTHVAPWGTFVTSKVTDPLGKPSAVVTVQTQVVKPSATGILLKSTIVDPKGKVVGEAETAAGSKVTQTIKLKSAMLWSLEHPNLYRLNTKLIHDGKVFDSVDTNFGIRTLRFDATHGFFLNERPVKIKGTCNHQDVGGIGVAVPDKIEEWRVAQLKKMGSNAWRTSHNPPNAELLDACDRLGMLVMDETRHFGDALGAKSEHGTGYSDLSELAAMIQRDRNHPSIIMWSMLNEEPLQCTPEGARIFEAMRAKVYQYDKTRPLTGAINDSRDTGAAAVVDLRGFNYSVWAYNDYHKKHPDKPLFGSETASTVATRGVYEWETFRSDNVTYHGNKEKGWVSAWDVNAPSWANTAEASWTPQAENEWNMGGFLWTGFDYKGEPTPFGWPDISSHFGILDMVGFPKDDFYYYKSWWTSTPVVHILPHWNWSGKEGSDVHVWVFSNADKVDLFLNGQSLGAKPMRRNSHLEWIVPYSPGVLVAKGFDAGGKLLTSDRIETTGAPAALKLTTERSGLLADAEDATVVSVSVVDAKGRVVPTAGNRVTFAVKGQGRIAGVGNGNPTDHDPDKANNRLAFNGLCAVIVGSTDKSGKITLRATSPGLKPAEITLSAK